MKIDLSCQEIVEHFSDMVYRIAISQVKNKEDAEDVYQDIFVSLIKNIHKIENETHLKHWLIRSTINRCKNHFTCFWSKNIESLDDNNLFEKETSFYIDEVRGVIQSLPYNSRSIVMLYYYEQYTIKEISEILKIKEGTVKSRLHKARMLLKNMLKEEITI